MLAATIGRFEFKKDGEKGVVVMAETAPKQLRGMTVSVRDVAWE